MPVRASHTKTDTTSHYLDIAVMVSGPGAATTGTVFWEEDRLHRESVGQLRKMYKSKISIHIFENCVHAIAGFTRELESDGASMNFNKAALKSISCSEGIYRSSKVGKQVQKQGKDKTACSHIFPWAHAHVVDLERPCTKLSFGSVIFGHVCGDSTIDPTHQSPQFLKIQGF